MELYTSESGVHDCGCQWIRARMPYDSTISVNKIHPHGNRRRGLVTSAVEWLTVLKCSVAHELVRLPRSLIPPIRVDMHCCFPKKRGRRPDVDNFRKYPQDAIASALGIDDCHYCGDNTFELVPPNEARLEFTITEECRVCAEKRMRKRIARLPPPRIQPDPES